jgi:hypothetical protein
LQARAARLQHRKFWATVARREVTSPVVPCSPASPCRWQPPSRSPARLVAFLGHRRTARLAWGPLRMQRPCQLCIPARPAQLSRTLLVGHVRHLRRQLLGPRLLATQHIIHSGGETLPLYVGPISSRSGGSAPANAGGGVPVASTSLPPPCSGSTGRGVARALKACGRSVVTQPSSPAPARTEAAAELPA